MPCRKHHIYAVSLRCARRCDFVAIVEMRSSSCRIYIRTDVRPNVFWKKITKKKNVRNSIKCGHINCFTLTSCGLDAMPSYSNVCRIRCKRMVSILVCIYFWAVCTSVSVVRTAADDAIDAIANAVWVWTFCCTHHTRNCVRSYARHGVAAKWPTVRKSCRTPDTRTSSRCDGWRECVDPNWFCLCTVSGIIGIRAAWVRCEFFDDSSCGIVSGRIDCTWGTCIVLCRATSYVHWVWRTLRMFPRMCRTGTVACHADCWIWFC